MSNATFPIINVLVVSSPRGLSVSLPGANPFNMPSESGTESAALAADPRKQDDEWCQQWCNGGDLERFLGYFNFALESRKVCVFFFQGWLSSAEEQKPSTKEADTVFFMVSNAFQQWNMWATYHNVLQQDRHTSWLSCLFKRHFASLQMHLYIQDGSPMMQRYWNLQGFSWQ